MITEAITALTIAASMTPAAQAATSYPNYVPGATAYCDYGKTASGVIAQPGSVAQNTLPLGSKIKTNRPVFGRRIFFVHDHIGHGSSLDFWTSSCSRALNWGRGAVRYKVLRRGW